MIPKRFEDMRQLTVSLDDELKTFTQYGYGDEHDQWVLKLLRKRLSGTPLRAYFVAKTSEWLQAGMSPWQRWRQRGRTTRQLTQVQLPLIFETVITIQYLHNQILDGKSGVTTTERISENLLAANLLREQLYRYVAGECPSWARAEIEKTVRRCFELVDLGQHLEQQANKVATFYDPAVQPNHLLTPAIRQQVDLSGVALFIAKIKADLPRNHHEYIDLYFNRIYLTCAALFVEAAELLIQLFRLTEHQGKAIRQFSLCYGLMRQLVNDNADWVPSSLGLSTQSKKVDDAFSDLRRGTVTLPLIFFLAEHEGGVIRHLAWGQMTWSRAFEQEVFTEMLESNALFKSIQNTRILGELALSYLPLHELSAAFLADTCEIVHWNKFLVPCLRHPAYQNYRKTAYHQRTRRLIRRLRKERQEPAWQPGRIPSLGSWLRRPTLPQAVFRVHQLLQQEIRSAILAAT